MALNEDSSKNILRSNSNCSTIRENQKKASEYFQWLDTEKQNELVLRFENEKIISDILKTLYKKDGIKSLLFKVMFNDFIYLYFYGNI